MIDPDNTEQLQPEDLDAVLDEAPASSRSPKARKPKAAKKKSPKKKPAKKAVSKKKTAPKAKTPKKEKPKAKGRRGIRKDGKPRRKPRTNPARSPAAFKYGRKVAKLRVAKKLTQYELAQKAKISQPGLANIERGVAGASEEMRAKLVKVLGKAAA